MDEWYPGGAGNMLGGAYEVLGSMWTKRTMMVKGIQNLGALVVGHVYFSIVHGPRRICRMLRFIYYGRRSRSCCEKKKRRTCKGYIFRGSQGDVVCRPCDAQREESPHVEPWPMMMRDSDAIRRGEQVRKSY
jgi:hypothetical protein